MITENQKIELTNKNVELFIKREDLIHPVVSGNKYRKLKYNIEQAKEGKNTVLLTFGGAFSNHIAAVAYSGKVNGFKTIGVIRGEEIENITNNPTLNFAKECGMKFDFVTRDEYRNKSSDGFIERLKQKHGFFYLIPEGGTNELAVKGCEEIIADLDYEFDYICCAVGTGGTISGLINSSFSHQKIIGFPALKGDFLQKDICKFAKKNNWNLETVYNFGGYGKVTTELIQFINSFSQSSKIYLDPVYTGKMVFGVMDMIDKNYFEENSKILMIHTGGLQGIYGMNNKLKNKKIPIIEYND